MKKIIEEYINKTSATIDDLHNIYEDIEKAARLMVETFSRGGKVMVFGNGGSAADAQHIAAELVSRFRKERAAMPVIALTTNTSIMTAISNDYDFDRVLARQLEALAQENDLVMAISTSGNSQNIITAVDRAKEKNLKVISLTGSSGGALEQCSDVIIKIPSDVTSHIQEGHIIVYHLLCHLVEEELF